MATDSGCIFCKIVEGQIPCWKVYEDGAVVAFLDIGPLSEGHCLIVPKAHHVTIDQMTGEEASACARVIPALSRAVKEATGAAGWNVLQNNGPFSGQVVQHVHFHIIPRREGDGLGFRWHAGKLGEETAKRLVSEITNRLRG